MTFCTSKCWTPVDCLTCRLQKAPRGRSVPLEAASGYCDHECPGYDQPPPAPHLWSEHDDSRHYSDPAGWRHHVENCADCRGDDGEDAR